MERNIKLRREIKEFLTKIRSAEDIYRLFELLNYPKNILLDVSYKRKIKEFELKSEVKSKIKDIYTVLSFEKNLLVFLVETTSLSSSLIKDLTKNFSDKYENFLLVLTRDYYNLLFVFPEFEKVGDKYKLKLTKLFFERDEPYYTGIETLSNLFYEGTEKSWRDVRRKWKEAFNVERVTEIFFEDYKDIFFRIRNKLIKQKINRKDAHEFTLQFLNRIMFIYFISKKRWLNYDTRFIRNFWYRYLSERNKGNTKHDTFYDKWLRSLFFKAFNNKQSEITELPRDLKEIFFDFPYLNGGLFTENDLDKLNIKIEDSLFKTIFEFFEKYNFTIKEDMPLEKEVAVDPQMLGYVYESLANVAEEIYDRTDLGIFYTPRVEVDFMCRRSLVEYLAKHLPEIRKDRIYEFVFDEDKEKVEKCFTKSNFWYKIKEVLDNLSIVDPACGSGAFLVGLLRVLTELYEVVYKNINRGYRIFDLKNSIISRSLYGVDVMSWAVHAAELRLWLNLIIETEFSKEELKKRPLLPNLNLNLRVGDSLVQEIGGLTLNLRSKDLPEKVKRKLLSLKEAKERYFYNLPTELQRRKDFLEEEVRIFNEIIDERIQAHKKETESLTKRIASLKKTKQITLTGKTSEIEQKKIIDEKEKLENIIAKITEEIKNLENIKRNLRDPEKKPFVWEIDFAEIFGDKGGFDIVIGNPPYVNYKKISPPNKEKKDVTEKDKEDYKNKLLTSVRVDFPIIKTINGMSDYYIYFYFKGLSILNQNGVFCFITSNFWLDVDYGKDLQEFLLKYVPIIAIYDNPKRSFKHSDINTIIAVFGSPQIKENSIFGLKIHDNNWLALSHTAKFVMFKKPFEEVLTTENLIDIENIKVQTRGETIIDFVKNVVNTQDYRIFPITQEDLLEDGWGYPEDYDIKGKGKLKAGKYEGNKWGGKYLRAPDIFFRILSSDLVIKLSDIAGIKTGLKESGYRDYIKPIRKVTARRGLLPIIKNVKVLNKINIENNDSFIIKNIHHFKKLLKNKKSEILWLAMRGGRHICYRNIKQYGFTGNFFGVELIKNKVISTLMLLNSTITFLFFEILARKGFGGGSAIMVKSDLENHMLTLKPNAFEEKRMNKIYNKISRREIKSIFEECGIDPSKPIREQEPKPLPDRAELDKIIFDELGLTKEERKEVYWSVCELVKDRLEKARSFKTRKVD